MAKAPGVVTGRYGTIGNIYYVKEDYFPLNTTLYVKDFKGNDPGFISYHLRTIDFNSCSDKAAVPGVNRNHLHELQTAIPPIAEQKAIAHILGTLDDKIELNRKTNETLEAMAKALFKSWFVDFDPVRAKGEGRSTGLPAQISDLFPDSFEDSELGEIPSGWRVSELGDLYTIGKGGIWGDDTCSGADFTEVSCLRGIDCHNLSSGSIPVVPSRWVKKSQVESRIPEDGAILIEGSGSFCGRSLLWEEKYRSLFERPVVYSNFCKRLTPACPKVYSSLVWMALRDSYDRNEVANFRTGTAFPNLDVSGLLKGVSIVLPCEGIAAAFQEFYLLRNRVDLINQSASLSDIRDALLPKLISGEIRIPDAEKMLEEVGV
jgi:type I restriction enzyme S subunit